MCMFSTTLSIIVDITSASLQVELYSVDFGFPPFIYIINISIFIVTIIVLYSSTVI